MNNPKALAFTDLTSDAVKNLPAEQYLVIWPIGALEQHGPHLPLGTDSLVLDAVVQQVRLRLGRDFKGLFLPELWYGKSPEHLAFPGTVSLRATTLIAIAEDLVASLAPHGFKNIVFLNGHGGNTPLLDAIGYDLNYSYGTKIYYANLWDGAFFNDIIEKLFPTLAGTEVHAASIETSLLMYLAPETVGEIPHFDTFVSFKDRLPASWVSHEFDTSGVIGDPSLASAEAGRQIMDYTVERVCDLLKRISEEVTQAHPKPKAI